jgi:hypothetical protein
MSIDQYEFDPPDSEQFLELAISSATRHQDLGAFLAECGASAISGRSPDAGWGRWEMVRDHLGRFAGLELPPPGGCRELILLRDDWDDLELAIMSGADLVWYHWYTSA